MLKEQAVSNAAKKSKPRYTGRDAHLLFKYKSRRQKH